MWIFVLAIVLAVVLYGCNRLSKTNISDLRDVEKRLSPKAALQFALDNNLPLKTSVGETDGRNVWNASVSGLRVPGDLCGGERKQTRLKRLRERAESGL